MKIYLFNDTTGISMTHEGSIAVMKVIRKRLSKYDVIATHHVTERKYNKKAMDECDVVVVNGEGTIHHNRPNGVYLMKVLRKAQALGKRTVLVNALFEVEPPFYRDVLEKLDFLGVREPWSEHSAKCCGGNPVVYPDLVLDDMFMKGVPYTSGSIVIGEVISKLVRLKDGVEEAVEDKILEEAMLPKVWLNRPFEDVIATLKKCSLYITGQHHGIYAAAMAGVPFVPVVSNSHKIHALMDWSKLPIRVCTFDSEVRERVEWTLKNKKMLKDFSKFLLSQPRMTQEVWDKILKKGGD